MYSTAATPARIRTAIRYADLLAHQWLATQAPCRWQRKVSLHFRFVEFASLEPAGSWKHPDLVRKWTERILSGRAIAPLIVCATPRGTWYLHDGNHRHEALECLCGAGSHELVRVAELVPGPGYHFRFVHFREYGTYILFQDERTLPRQTFNSEAPQWSATPLAQ